MKLMRKAAAIILAVCMIGISGGSVFAAEEKADSQLDLPVTVLPAEGLGDLADLLYEMPDGITVGELIEIGTKNLKVLKAYKPFLEESAYQDLSKALAAVKRSETVEAADTFMQLWQGLVQTKPIEGNVWYLWDEGKMPTLDGEELTEADYEGAMVQDNPDYRPFVLLYLLDKPESARGNLLINAGGERSNENEGYPVAELFNSLGYNCFVVNRRSLPYKYEDKAMDLQRAIRLVKYHAQEEGWGGQNLVASCGLSAGGIVILGCINELYGDRTPQIFDAEYIPDEIDAINSDLDAVVTVYFGGTEIETDAGVPDYAKPEFLLNEENPNWPAMYLCSGVDDTYGADGTAQKIYDQIEGKVPCMLHLIEGARHGFGIGQEDVPETFGWPYEADVFMQQYMKEAAKEIAEAEEASGAETESEAAEEAAGEDASEEAATDEAATEETAEKAEVEDAEAEEAAAETAAEEAEVEDAAENTIPERFTKVKYFFGMYTFTNSDVVFAMNDEETEFHAEYTVMSHENVIEGTVEDGVVTVTYNAIGFAADDAQMMYDDAMSIEDPWEPIVR